MRLLTFVIYTACFGAAASTSEPNEYAPILVDQDDVAVTSYVGNITENEGSVHLTPGLRAVDKDTAGGPRFICGYKIFADDTAMLPFAVVLKSHKTGEADIVLDHGVFLDYEVRSVYSFNVSAYDCGTPTRMSDKIPVHIVVHEFSEPIWQEEAYFAEIEEGAPKQVLLQVQAYERHKTAGNRICSYKIMTPDVPFTIDEQGNIRLNENERLVYADSHNHILAVAATDCAGRQSKQVMVNFIIKPECKLGWQGIPDKLDYYPATGRKPFATNARFGLCKAPCDEERVTTSIFLSTKGQSEGCDRDVASIMSQRKLCGALADGVDLLPPPELYASWTNNIDDQQPAPTVDAAHRDDVYSFDGVTNAIKIPDGKINHTLTDHFTIMLWMKHGHTMESNRENIVCNADGEEMSRHHYALFIRNCRLVFLLREEYNKQDFDKFRPAEWRWKLTEVCDGKWHHYAVSVDYPQVHLYVDGRLFMESKANPVIVDDWPLHPAKKIHFTELVVGACWEGGEQHLAQFFKGWMAGLTITRGKTESDTVIRCLNNCKEKLDFHAIYMMEGGMSISYNSEMTQLTINSRNLSQVQRILSEVGYINYRMFPTPGRRDIKITTDIKCAGVDTSILKVPDVNVQILVQDGGEPVITITGLHNVMPYEQQLKTGGVKLFDGLTITETISRRDGGAKSGDLLKKVAETFAAQNLLKGKVFAENEADLKPADVPAAVKQPAADDFVLDSCSVLPDAALNADESLYYPGQWVSMAGLNAKANQDGLKIDGTASLMTYQSILRLVHYTDTSPEDTRQRTFSLRCSQRNSRYISNEFKVVLTVIHTVPKTGNENAHAHAQASNIHYSAKSPQSEVLFKGGDELNLVKKETRYIGSSTNFNAIVITVICLGFLMFMIILGVIRIRDAHNRTKVVHVEERGDDEMEWDNSALTITVNPMDDDPAGPDNFDDMDREAGCTLRDESESEDEDASSYRDDDLETSEDESPDQVKRRELEWDDSTLSY